MPSMSKEFSPVDEPNKSQKKMQRSKSHHRNGRAQRPRGKSVISNASSQSDAEGVFTNVTRLGMLEELDNTEDNYNW